MIPSAAKFPDSPELQFAATYEAVLEQIAAGAALPDVLNQLTRLVEVHAQGLLCSILVLDADGVSFESAPAARPPRKIHWSGLESTWETGGLRNP